MTPVVLDSSVGVKWFRDEPGSAMARELLRAHGRGEITIVVPSLFVYELMSVATRLLGDSDVHGLWRRFLRWRIHVREVSDSLVREALGVRSRLDCSLYDAIAPALADQLQAKLYSADQRAHGGLPGVELVE